MIQHQPRHQDEYVIHTRQVLPFLAWVRDIILTVLLWVLYFFLMRDAFSFVADLCRWIFSGFSDGFAHIGWSDLSTLVNFSMLVAIIFIVFLWWSAYNFYRFAGKTRRRRRQSIRAEDVGRYYNIPTELVAKWQNQRRLIITHEADGQLWHVMED